MILAIKLLPDISVKLWETNQQEAMQDKRNFWRYVGMRIDYLQKKQAGFLPADPADDKALHSRQREHLDLYSRYKFAILNVLIEGWDIIKNVSIREGRPFPFANPRELFTQICRECANGSVEDMLSTGIDQTPTLNELRDSMTDLGAFLRRRLEDGEHKKMLSICKDGEWYLFWLFATSDYWFRKELRDVWKQFLKAHKDITHFAKETKPREGTTLAMVKCHQGRTVWSDTGKPV